MLDSKLIRLSCVLNLIIILIPIHAVHADSTNSIVIIDSGFDTSLKELQGRIIFEVCIMEVPKCPNGKSFQEGSESATLPVDKAYVGTFNHGTKVAQVAVSINPQINIVAIRIIPADNMGNPDWSSASANSTVKSALDWVVKNRTKFNIIAVLGAVGHRPSNPLPDYCVLNYAKDPALKQSIAILKSMGVISIFANGNNADKTRIDYPACTENVIAVGSVEPDNFTVAGFSNDAPETDFYTISKFNISTGSVSGTSGSAAAFIAYWAKYYLGNIEETFNFFKSIATDLGSGRAKVVIDVSKEVTPPLPAPSPIIEPKTEPIIESVEDVVVCIKGMKTKKVNSKTKKCPKGFKPKKQI